MRSLWSEDCIEKYAIAEVRKDIVDTIQRLFSQVPSDETFQKLTSVQDGVLQVDRVVCEFNLHSIHVHCIVYNMSGSIN